MKNPLTWFEHTPLGQAYFARSESDLIVIASVAALFLLSILWLLAWKPVFDWHSDAVSRMETAQSSLDYLKANEALARRAASQTADQSGSLMPLVTRAANAQQLNLNRLQPEAGGVLNVFLEGQSFDRVFQWIAQLEQNNGIRVRTLSVRGSDAPGAVNVQVRLYGGGG